MEGLFGRWATQGDASAHRGIHPPLPAARVAQGIGPHPPLWSDGRCERLYQAGAVSSPSGPERDDPASTSAPNVDRTAGSVDGTGSTALSPLPWSADAMPCPSPAAASGWCCC